MFGRKNITAHTSSTAFVTFSLTGKPLPCTAVWRSAPYSTDTYNRRISRITRNACGSNWLELRTFQENIWQSHYNKFQIVVQYLPLHQRNQLISKILFLQHRTEQTKTIKKFIQQKVYPHFHASKNIFLPCCTSVFDKEPFEI